MNFAHLIENAISSYVSPEYKQLVVELFCVVYAIFKRNPELEFLGNLQADSLITEAVNLFKKVRYPLVFSELKL